MSRYNQGTPYENHPRTADLHDSQGHVHRVGEEHGKQEHLTGHEQSRLTAEHSPGDEQHVHPATVGHGIEAFGHAEIAALANEMWRARGCPEGSPDEDWFRAARELRSRAHSE